VTAPSDRIDYGVVQQLPGLGPVPGQVWRNRHSGDWYTIVSLQQRRTCWVTLRGVYGEREISLQDLETYYQATTR